MMVVVTVKITIRADPNMMMKRLTMINETYDNCLYNDRVGSLMSICW